MTGVLEWDGRRGREISNVISVIIHEILGYMQHCGKKNIPRQYIYVTVKRTFNDNFLLHLRGGYLYM
jgi:hypothetical protein